MDVLPAVPMMLSGKTLVVALVVACEPGHEFLGVRTGWIWCVSEER